MRADELVAGARIYLANGDLVEITDPPRRGVGGKMILRWRSAEILPNGLPAKEGTMTSLDPGKEFKPALVDLPAAA